MQWCIFWDLCISNSTIRVGCTWQNSQPSILFLLRKKNKKWFSKCSNNTFQINKMHIELWYWTNCKQCAMQSDTCGFINRLLLQMGSWDTVAWKLLAACWNQRQAGEEKISIFHCRHQVYSWVSDIKQTFSVGTIGTKSSIKGYKRAAQLNRDTIFHQLSCSNST